MSLVARLRTVVKAGRKRRAAWVAAFDTLRLLSSSAGRARLWTMLTEADEIHQRAGDTWEERYPELFHYAASLEPDARRILSFGCSTGEELTSLRRRFPEAEIVGAEINARSRRIAAQHACDSRISVVHPEDVGGTFDLVFALAVLQRNPAFVEEAAVADLSGLYPHEMFAKTLARLVRQVRTGGYLCIMHAQYMPDGDELEPVKDGPVTHGPFFGTDGRRLEASSIPAFYRKR